MDKEEGQSMCSSYFMAGFLRARIVTLIDVLRDLEEGNASQENADENLKNVTKDLNWFRKECLRN